MDPWPADQRSDSAIGGSLADVGHQHTVSARVECREPDRSITQLTCPDGKNVTATAQKGRS